MLRSGTSMGYFGFIAFAMYFLGGLVVAAVCGLPILAILRALALVNWWSTLFVGAVLGLAIGWISAVDEVAFGVVA